MVKTVRAIMVPRAGMVITTNWSIGCIHSGRGLNIYRKSLVKWRIWSSERIVIDLYAIQFLTSVPYNVYLIDTKVSPLIKSWQLLLLKLFGCHQSYPLVTIPLNRLFCQLSENRLIFNYFTDFLFFPFFKWGIHIQPLQRFVDSCNMYLKGVRNGRKR